MTALSMPKNRDVTVHQGNFLSFLQQIIKTINDHLQYTENDTSTETIWNNFTCNGILDDSLHNVESVAHLLEITDTAQMTLGNVVVELFESLNVLRHYYAITKVNDKSIKIRRIVINDMKKFYNDLSQDARKKLIAPKSGTKQTVLPAAFGNVEATELSDTAERKDLDIEPKPSNEKEDDLPQSNQPQGDDQGFMLPKRTVKNSIQEVPANSNNSNKNSFELLQDTDDKDTDDNGDEDNNTDKLQEDLDEDISYESSNHPATGIILTKVMNMAKKLSEDDEEIEIFAKWIESDVAPLMNESAKSVYAEATQKAQDLMRENTDKYLRKRIQELTSKIKSTAEQSQINVMTHINGQSNVLLQAHQNSLNAFTEELAKLKDINDDYKEKYKRDLNAIQLVMRTC